MAGKFCVVCNQPVERGQQIRERKKKDGGGHVHSTCFWESRRKDVIPSSHHGKLAAYAENMRNAPTAAEREMNRRLIEYGKHRGWVVVFQQPFMSWIFDFYLERMGVFIEVDGSSHDLPERQKKDEKKQMGAESKGFKVVRIRNADVASFDLSTIPVSIDDGEMPHEWLERWWSKKKPKTEKDKDEQAPARARLIKKVA